MQYAMSIQISRRVRSELVFLVDHTFHKITNTLLPKFGMVRLSLSR